MYLVELVGKIDKRKIVLDNPFQYIHKMGAKAGAASVSDIVISLTTDKYIRAKVAKAIKKQFPGISKRQLDKSIAYEMLQWGPAVSPDKSILDFHLYIRIEK